jgi:DNA primase catalytic core
MVNSHNNPVQGRKEGKQDFHQYVDDLKSRLDIVSIAQSHGIPINEHGQAQCFNGHDDKTPSLTFYEESQSYHCFGCKAHGDVISLVQHVAGCSFHEAMSVLAQQAGLPLLADNRFDPALFGRVCECMAAAADIYHAWLSLDDPYMAERGISYDTAQHFMVGRTRGKNDLIRALTDRGFDLDLIRTTGLSNANGADFFQNHIVVPIRSWGRVVDFYGRALDNDGDQRHWRLSNDRYMIGDGPFNWDPNCKGMILVEGVFDALALVEHGFSPVTAVFGTQGLKERYVRQFKRSRVEKVFVCYDGDASGHKAAIRDAYALEDMGKDARIIQLPDTEDPASFFKNRSATDFQELLDGAKRPIDVEIDRIQALEQREDILEEVKDRLLPRVRKADPIMQPDMLKKIHDGLDVPMQALKDQLKLLSDPEPEDQKNTHWEERGPFKSINPALDLVDGSMLILTPRRVVNADDPIPRWQNTVVTSQRERFVLDAEHLVQRGWYAPAMERLDINLAEERYSSQAINGFLRGQLQGDLAATYKDIRRTVKLYLDFTDERTYDFVTCWIIGTYLYILFSHYPYIHFTGPKASGKSQCLHVLQSLCHNAKMAGSMTLAVQFRLIGALQPTILFDEMENLGQTLQTELHRMIKYGFEKNGPQVWRMENRDKKMEMRSWSVYCPRAFASIEGMEDVIGSRSVQIIMERSFDDEIKKRTVNSEDPLWQKLRDQLFLVALTDGPRIKQIYESIVKPPGVYFAGRDWDIFKGLLSVAQAVGDPAVYERMVTFAVASHETKMAADHDNSPDIIILQYLSDVVTQYGLYELGELNAGLTAMATTQGLDLQGPMTRDRLGKRLRALRVYEQQKRSVRNGRKVTLYEMNPDVIRRKLENHLCG